MTLLLHRQTDQFEGFGTSILASPTRGALGYRPVPDDRMAARSMLHDHCPLTPGIYAWLDHNQQICYVGKSKSLRKRLLSYFAKTPADKKSLRIRQHSKTLVWEPISDELLALIREQELIYRWRPEFNVQGQPTKRQPAFICIRGGMAPNAFFTRRAATDSDHMLGPIPGTGQLRAAVDSINQCFQLRDCPDKTKFEFDNQTLLFTNPQSAQCIRFELGTCPAPCAGFCSQSNYLDNVQHATEFIHGKDVSILNRVKNQMNAAANRQAFEKAAAYRDHLANLTWLNRQLETLRTARQTYNGILPLPSWTGKDVWLILKGSRLVQSIAAPDTPQHARVAIKLLRQISLEIDSLPATIFEMNLQLIIMAWFRRYPEKKPDLRSFDDAIQICRTRINEKQPKIS